MALDRLPPPPAQSPLLDPSGRRLSTQWQSWFDVLYKRLGGATGSTIPDLDAHVADMANPHQTTAAQVGVASSSVTPLPVTESAAGSAGTSTSFSRGDHRHALALDLDAYADDAAAAAGGVPVGGLYRTASAVKIRVS